MVMPRAMAFARREVSEAWKRLKVKIYLSSCNRFCPPSFSSLVTIQDRSIACLNLSLLLKSNTLTKRLSDSKPVAATVTTLVRILST